MELGTIWNNLFGVTKAAYDPSLEYAILIQTKLCYYLFTKWPFRQHQSNASAIF